MKIAFVVGVHILFLSFFLLGSKFYATFALILWWVELTTCDV